MTELAGAKGGDRWLADLPATIAALERRWGITVGERLPGGTSSYVAAAVTATGEPAVVKISVPLVDFDQQVRTLRAAGGRVIPVGTTALRLLETAATSPGVIGPWRGETDIFIRPGHAFRVIDGLMTNFHLPKSTLLMLAAGLLEPDAGQVLVDDRLVAGGGTWVPPEDRRVGVVFQDAALFPHLRVADNIAFGVPRGRDRAARVQDELLVALDADEREQLRLLLDRVLAAHPAQPA